MMDLCSELELNRLSHPLNQTMRFMIGPRAAAGSASHRESPFAAGQKGQNIFALPAEQALAWGWRRSGLIEVLFSEI